MKNIFKSILCVAVAAMAFTACSTADINEEVTVPQTVTVKVNAVADSMTRTSFGEYDSTSKTFPTLWDGDETVRVSLNKAETHLNAALYNSTDITTSADKASADITFSLTDDASGEYTLYAICPASAVTSGINTGGSNHNWNLKIPNTQTPGTDSCDPAAQILYGTSETKATLTEGFDIAFKHFTAYAKFSFTNLELGDAVVTSIELKSSVNIAGNYNYYVDTTQFPEKTPTNTITLNTTETENIWVALAPVDVSGKTLTFTIYTDKGPMVKEVTMPANRVFESGKVSAFNVNMEGVTVDAGTTETWNLVTDLNDIIDGTYIILTKPSGVVYVPNTTATAKNVLQKTTELFDCVANSVTTNLVADDMRWTFTSTTGGFHITNPDGKYLYASNTNNGVAVTTTASVWTFEEHSKSTGNIAMKEVSNSRYLSAYSTTNWRTYTNLNSGSNVIYLYQLEDLSPIIVAKDVESIPVAGVTSTLDITTKNLTENITVTTDGTVVTSASVTGSTLTYTVSANAGVARSGWIKLAANGVECTIAVSQFGSDTKYYEKVTEVSAGTYLIVAGSNALTPFTSNYAYPAATVVTIADNKIASDDSTNALSFTFVAAEGGYQIMHGDYYYYQTGSYNNINRSTTAPTTKAEAIWSMTYNNDTDGTFKILNTSVEKYIQYSTSYSNFGSYTDEKGTMPSLYKLSE